MWLVQTLLDDIWFYDLTVAFTFYDASPKTRTYPRLDGDWPVTAGAFQQLVR